MRYLKAPGNWRKREWATHVGDGVYEVELVPPREGAYYVNVECPSLRVRANELPTLILQARRAASQAPRGRLTGP